jgi:hypothetical protein
MIMMIIIIIIIIIIILQKRSEWNKMNKNIIEHQNRDQESKVENDSHPSAEGEQHIKRRPSHKVA